ncbi:hypothetical protein LTR56_018294 [Elasticomyces elasticus]|nr:hypothetical protein LTR56_018294 [Elasticomyces elasticus]KAK4912353.1 hypothetical protein LTR49_019171 [Elasticomyces elasticus]KAK5751853.1 hypothetical protein LTS12_018094 [Elasticomyces elasticus]
MPPKAKSNKKAKAGPSTPIGTPPTNTPAASPTQKPKRRKKTAGDGEGDDSEAPMSASKKTTARETADQTEKQYYPGKREDTKTFYRDHQVEARVAAYCGFGNIGQFRRFLRSHHFVEYYLRYIEGNWAKGMMRVNPSLDLIRDQHIDQPTRQHYPLDQPDKYFKDRATKDKPKYLAHLLILMVANLDASAVGEEMQLDAVEQTQADADLTPFLEKATQALPDLGDSPVFSPHFNTEFDESDLEAYNRAWMLLKYFSYCVNGEKPWTKRFEPESWNEDKTVSLFHIPKWMRTGSSVKVPNPGAEAHKNMLRIPIKLIWKKKGPFAAALKQYIEDNDELDFTTVQVDSEADPRVHDQVQFRDIVRRQYNCRDLGLQIANLNMTLPAASNDEDDAEDFDLMVCDWEGLRNIFLTIPADTVVTTEVRFRVLEDGETFEFESLDAPPQLASFFKVADGEVLPQDETNDAGQEDEHEDFLKATGIRNSKPAKWEPEPTKRFSLPADREKFLRHHDGFDVTDPVGLRNWQLHTLKEILNSKPAPISQENKRKKIPGGKKVEAALDKLSAAVKMGEFSAMAGGGGTSNKVSNEADELEYYVIQGAFSGTEAQLGPLLEPCLVTMGMERLDLEDGEDFHKYKCTLLTGVERTFYPYQVTGAAYILLRLLGTIPLPDYHAILEDVQKCLSALATTQTCGLIDADFTGLGKTVETLLALAFLEAFWEEVDGSGVQTVFKPHLIAVPAGAISTWAREIDDHWPIFNLAISYDKDALETRYKDRVISSSTMKALPEDREGLTSSGKDGFDFSYLFDDTRPENHKTIVLTSHDTHGERFCTLEVEHIPAVYYDPVRLDEDGNPKVKFKAKQFEYYATGMRDAFLTATIDEVHMIKNPDTRNFAGVFLMHAKYHILISATPMQNNAGDIIGPLMLLADSVESLVAQSQICQDFLKKVKVGWREAFEGLANSDINDPRRLCLMNPRRVASLLRTGNPVAIQQYYHLAEDLFVLRRSPNSVIKVNEEGATLSLASMMKPHTIKTTQLKREGEQARLYEWFHVDAARRYVTQLSGGPNAENHAAGVHIPSMKTPGGEISKGPQIVYPVVPLRDLDIANTSTLLARFNLLMRKAKSSTLVQQMEQWRAEGMDAVDFIKFVRRLGDRPIKTRKDAVKFLSDGSPMLIEVFRQYRDQVLLKGEKLLMVENVPLSAWWEEIACRLLLIPIATMHSGLDQSSRTKLAKQFNAPGGLMVLTIMHDVGGQSINLQEQCHRVLVLHPGISMAKLLQSIGRVIRVNQKHPVDVSCLFVKNSHSAWRTYRQGAKVLVELASRAYDPDVRELLVRLLQEHQDDCDAAHDSEEGKLALEYLKAQGAAGFGGETPIEGLAGTFDDSNESAALTQVSASATTTREKRKTKEPDRFVPWAYNGPGGTLIKDPVKRQKAVAKEAKKYFKGAAADTEEDAEGHDGDGEYQGGSGEGPEEEDDDDRDPYGDHIRQLSKMEREEVFCTDEVNDILAKVKVKKGHVYIDEDLDDAIILRRALMLLYKARMGLPFLIEATSIHIDYASLPDKVRTTLKKLAETSQKDAILIAKNFGAVKLAPQRKVKADRANVEVKRLGAASAGGQAKLKQVMEAKAEVEDEEEEVDDGIVLLHERLATYQAFLAYGGDNITRKNVENIFHLRMPKDYAEEFLGDYMLQEKYCVGEMEGEDDDLFSRDNMVEVLSNLPDEVLTEMLEAEAME